MQANINTMLQQVIQ